MLCDFWGGGYGGGAFKRLRHVYAERHLPGQRTNDQLESAGGAHVAELLEPPHHPLIDPGMARRRLGTRQLILRHVCLVRLMAGTMGLPYRLEDIPSRKHAQERKAMCLEDIQILGYLIGPPVLPHSRGGLGCPVVRAQGNPSIWRKGRNVMPGQRERERRCR